MKWFVGRTDSSLDNPPPEKLSRAGILLLCLLAAVIRFDGIAWGRPFTYHPDEHSVVHAALNMVRDADPNPHWFRYPSLVLYAQAVLVLLLQPFLQADLRTAPEVHGLGPWDVAPEHFPFLLAGRIAVATVGAASVALVARTVAGLASWPAAWLAAGTLAFAPLHVESSHYLTTDVPATFWITVTLWLALCGRTPRAWILAGAAAGLAAASKYPAGMVLAVPVLLLWLGRKKRVCLGVLACFGVAFSVTSPFVWLDFPTFLSDLEAQRAHYASGLSAAGNWWRYLASLASFGFGAVPLLLAVVGAVSVFVCGPLPRVAAVVCMAVPAGYFAYLSSWPLRFDRNLMPLLPFLCLFVGAGCDALLRSAGGGRWRKSAAMALAVALLAQPAYLSWELRKRWHAMDTRTEALNWIYRHLPTTAHIAREEYTPQVDGRAYRVSFIQVAGTQPYSWYLQNEVDYLVLSSNIYERFRIDRPRERWIAEFYRFVFTSLPLVAEFSPGLGRTGPTVRIYQVPRWREE